MCRGCRGESDIFITHDPSCQTATGLARANATEEILSCVVPNLIRVPLKAPPLILPTRSRHRHSLCWIAVNSLYISNFVSLFHQVSTKSRIGGLVVKLAVAMFQTLLECKKCNNRLAPGSIPGRCNYSFCFCFNYCVAEMLEWKLLNEYLTCGVRGSDFPRLG